MEEEVLEQDMAKLIRNNFSENANVVLHPGDCRDLLKQIPNNKIQLIITSPPYNIGKKYFKGPKKGQFSCNPLGKNPGDVWQIPNVKNNHVEKTIHPCQFPVELIERLVLSMTDKNDWVLDPFMETGTTAVAALLRGRKAVGAEIMPEYIDLAKNRIKDALRGEAKVRPMNKSIYVPNKKEKETSRIVTRFSQS